MSETKSTLKLRFRGAASSLGADGLKGLIDRSTADDDVLRDTVSATIDAVRHQGDTVLKSLAREYDLVSLKRLDARPIATMTLEAQEKHERRERVHRDD